MGGGRRRAGTLCTGGREREKEREREREREREKGSYGAEPQVRVLQL